MIKLKFKKMPPFVEISLHKSEFNVILKSYNLKNKKTWRNVKS